VLDLAGVAPGKAAKTSIIGTLIWGSSSRGSIQTAKKNLPRSTEAMHGDGRQLGRDEDAGDAAGEAGRFGLGCGGGCFRIDHGSTSSG
jgi:hypothetical protein